MQNRRTFLVGLFGFSSALALPERFEELWRRSPASGNGSGRGRLPEAVRSAEVQGLIDRARDDGSRRAEISAELLPYPARRVRFDPGVRLTRGDTSEGVYDITAYGADPSREDNRDAIQACLNAAAASGGVVLVPPGRYRIAGTLILEGSAATVVEGMGSQSTLVQTASAPILRLREQGHVVRRLGFEATDSAGRSVGVVIEPTADHARVSSCVFRRLPSSAVLMQPGLLGAIVDGNRCRSCGFGSDTRSPFDSTIRGADLTDCVVRENHLVDGANKGIDLGQAEKGNSNVAIVGNTVRRFPKNIGIGVGSGRDTLIAHNYVTGCGDNAIDVNDLAGLGNTGTVIEGNTCLASKDGIFFGHGAVDARIGGNTVRDCRRGMRILDGPERVVVSGNSIRGTPEDYGIEITDQGGEGREPRQILLQDNTVSDSAGAGVMVKGAAQVLVAGHMFSELESEAIRGEASRGLLIRGNLINKRSTSGTSTRSKIHLDGACRDFVVEDNVLLGDGQGNFVRWGGGPGVVASNRWATGDQRDAGVSSRWNQPLDQIPPNYDVRNAGTRRGLDARRDSRERIADVVGSLIRDLERQGIVR